MGLISRVSSRTYREIVKIDKMLPTRIIFQDCKKMLNPNVFYPEWKKQPVQRIWKSKKISQRYLDEAVAVPKSNMIWKVQHVETFPLGDSTTEKPKSMADHYLK